MSDYDPETNSEHLRILEIFHYVMGIIAIIFGFFPILHLFAGFIITTMGENADAPADMIGLLFLIIPGLMMLVLWTLGILTILAGKYISERRKRKFCLITAGILCIFFPIGTVLGIFTILVLSRSSVRNLFDGGDTEPQDRPEAPPAEPA